MFYQPLFGEGPESFNIINVNFAVFKFVLMIDIEIAVVIYWTFQKFETHYILYNFGKENNLKGFYYHFQPNDLPNIG